MLFVKGLGLGIYYRLRRMNKAFKNWRKFGVIIFGSIFVAASVFPYTASADDLRVEIYKSDHAVSSITIDTGDTSEFIARAFVDSVEVTSTTQFIWSMDGKYPSAQIGKVTQNGIYTAGDLAGFYSGAIKLTGTLNGKSDLDTVSVTINQAGTPPIPPLTQQTLTRVEIVDSANLPLSSFTTDAGKTKQFGAKSYDQNNQDITSKTSFIWSMDGKYPSAQAGFVNQTGLYTAGITAGFYSGALKLTGSLDGKSDLDTVSVTINTISTPIPPTTLQTLTRVEIVNTANLPLSSFTIDNNTTKQFGVKAYDQNNQDITSKTSFIWSMDGKYPSSQVGSITQTGLYTSGSKAGFYSGAMKLTGTFDGKSDLDTVSVTINSTVTPPVPPTTLQILTRVEIVDNAGVAIPSFTINTSKTKQLSARSYDQNDVDITNKTSFMWSMDGKYPSSQVGFINQSGLYTSGTKSGTYSGAVKLLGSFAGKNLLDTVTVTINAPIQPAKVLTSVVINPATARLAVGTQKQFTATAYDQNGAVIGSGVTFLWSLTDNSVGNINQAGLFTADHRTGNYTNLIKVVATYAGISKSAFAAIEVYDNVVDSILQYVVINPTTATLDMGGNYQFGVTAYDQFNHVINGQVNFSWITVNGGGSVNQNGLFVAGYNAGTYTNTVKVTGTKDGISRLAYATVIVRSGSVQSLLERVEITPTSVNVRINNQTDFNAQAYNSNNNPIYNASYYWTVISGPGSINQNGLFSASNLTGTATIQVKASQGGRDRYALATAYVYDNQINDTDLIYVRITPTIAYLNSGSSIDFNAQAYNSLGQLVSADYSWDLMSNIGTLNQSGYFTAGSNIGTFYDAIRVRAYRNGVERVDYADVVISASSNNQNNYGLSATLTANDENGGSLYENEVVVYSLQLTNNSTSTLTGATVTFDIPTSTSFMSVMSNDGASSINGKTIRFEAGTLSANATKTLTIKVRVNSSVPSNSVIRGKAYVWASEINAFWVFANDLFALGTAQPTGNIPLTDTGAIDWLIAGAASLVATILSKKFLIRSLL